MSSFHDGSILPDPVDVQSNKFMAILSYLGILVLIPLFAAKNSQYARFHVSQGVNVLLLYIISTTVSYIPLLPFDGFISWIVNMIALVFSILGIINAVRGEMKPLPIIGGLKIV